jgi:septal ring factor EnvC (AmiA/AmiB activator)
LKGEESNAMSDKEEYQKPARLSDEIKQLRRAINRLDEHIEKQEKIMATIMDELTQLQADDAAVVKALNDFATQIAALQAQIAAGTVPQATLDAFEKIHADLLAALNPTPQVAGKKK